MRHLQRLARNPRGRRQVVTQHLRGRNDLHVRDGGVSVSKRLTAGEPVRVSVYRVWWTPDERLARRLGVFLGDRPADGWWSFMVPCDGDGREFATQEEADAFLVERGYLREYHTSPALRARRVERAAEFPHPRRPFS